MRAVLPLGVLLVWLTTLPVVAQTTATRFAVVVGHNEGNHRTVPLLYAQKDASKMAELFGHLAGVPEANVRLLHGPDAEALEQALTGIRRELEPYEGVRTELFFYFSGHADEQGLLLGDSRFPLQKLREFLQASGADVTG